MTTMKRIILFLITPLLFIYAFSSCSFDDEPIEFAYTSVYFPNQEYIRNLVVGEGLAFKPGVIFAGVLENNINRSVSYVIDPSLVSTDQELLPEDYYTFEAGSHINIPKGQLKGYVQFRLDSAKFVADPKSLTGEYVLPLRLKETQNIDKITAGKETMVLSLSYYAKQHANYTYKGTTIQTPTDGSPTTITYTNDPTQTESYRLLRTVGPDIMRVEGDAVTGVDPVSSVTFYVKVPVYGGGQVTISADPDCAIAVSPNGESTYDEATRTFTLRYKYTLADGTECTANDVLVFRNRIRDVQSNGIDYINEWRF